jgi:membrane-bound lytic murein transglycosylase D
VSYELVTLPDYLAADTVAAALGVNEQELARFNPAVQATVWQGSKYLPKNFEIRIPSRLLEQPMAQLISAIPQDNRYSHQLPDLYHTIARGDTLSALAAEYGTNVSTLVALNGLDSSHRIRAGQRLRLPTAGPAPVVVAAEDSSLDSTQVSSQVSAEASGDVSGDVSGADPAEVLAEVPAEVSGDVSGAVSGADPAEVLADVPAEVSGEVSGYDSAVAALQEEERESERVPEPPAGALASAPAIGAITDETLVSEGALTEDAALPDQDPAESVLLSDPSDYTVDDNSSIEVQPLETLGHYADWLGIKTQRLRDINGLAFRTPVEVGQRIRLDFSAVSAETFENLRTSWHRQQQDAFFRNHRISGTVEHVVRQGESVWILSLRTYDVPIWLFRQYNPELDLHSVRPGTTLSFPVLSTIDESP